METPSETPETRKSPNAQPKHQGGGVLGQEQGTAPTSGVVTASPAEAALPFTGSNAPLLMLVGAGFLGLGLVLHRMSTDRG